MENVGKLLLGFGLMILMSSCGESDQEKDYLSRMSAEHKGDAPLGNASSELDQPAEVQGEEVVYATVNGEEITGYLVKPDTTSDDLPGIIVIHEWWGLNDNIRMMAEKLASEGYAALAVDLYNGRVAESPDSARTYAGSVQQNEAIDNLTQAYNFLAQKQAERNIGVIGWCFGGGWSLQTSLALPEKIDATVIYYGQLVTDTGQLKKLEMPVLGIFGAKDEGIPPEQVNKFEAALDEAGVTNSIHIYEGAGHAFANPSGTQYEKEAAEDAWQKTIAFLNEHLKE